MVEPNNKNIKFRGVMLHFLIYELLKQLVVIERYFGLTEAIYGPEMRNVGFRNIGHCSNFDSRPNFRAHITGHQRDSIKLNLIERNFLMLKTVPLKFNIPFFRLGLLKSSSSKIVTSWSNLALKKLL